MRNKIIPRHIAVLLTATLSILIVPHIVLAGTWQFDSSGTLSSMGLPTLGFDSIVFNTISYILSFFGLIALIMIMTGGMIYLTAGGNTERVDSAKAIIKNALIGMAIVILSYSATFFFYSTITLLSSPTSP